MSRAGNPVDIVHIAPSSNSRDRAAAKAEAEAAANFSCYCAPSPAFLPFHDGAIWAREEKKAFFPIAAVSGVHAFASSCSFYASNSGGDPKKALKRTRRHPHSRVCVYSPHTQSLYYRLSLGDRVGCRA